MTTATAISLRERVRLAVEEERRREAESEAAEGARLADALRSYLINSAREHLDVDLAEADVTVEGVESSLVKVYADVDGIRLAGVMRDAWNADRTARHEVPEFGCLVMCRSCERETFLPVRDLLSLDSALHLGARCDFCAQPDYEIVEPERPEITAITEAAERVATATAREMDLEDARALVKRDAIQRLIQSGQATSATAAEKIVEQDQEYVQHRQAQRECVVEKIRAWGTYEAAKLRARLTVEQAGAR